LVRIAGEDAQEVALHDITEVRCEQSRLDRLLGTRSVIVSTDRASRAVVLDGVQRGGQLAALLEILARDSRAALDRETIQAALEWEPQGKTRIHLEAIVSVAVVAVAILAAVHILHTPIAAATFAPDDPIAPNGQKRPRTEIVAFMEQQVMPWARIALGPIKGGADRITCETCHGSDADARGWQMPAVAALPQPDLRDQGWERYSGAMDAQMRNAIYGYLADSEKQTRAGYMREVVMPGMAGLLHRPPYDFTQPYGYNRAHAAFGCYHCHRVN
jgi:hypothetical protein